VSRKGHLFNDSSSLSVVAGVNEVTKGPFLAPDLR
jgi:hypothetical protein